jgi:hypothetical protein
VTVYRTPAEHETEAEEPEPEGVALRGGTLVRLHKDNHRCSPPGRWSRLWNRIREGDGWRCKCGNWWILEHDPIAVFIESHVKWSKR